MEAIDLDSLSNMSLDELDKLAYRLQIDYKPPLTEQDRDDIIEKIIKLSLTIDPDNIDIEELKRRNRDARKGKCNDETTLVGDDVDLLDNSKLVMIPIISNPGMYWCFDRVQDVPNLIQEGINPFTRQPWSRDELEILQESQQLQYPRLSKHDLERQEINKVYEDVFKGRRNKVPRDDTLKRKLEHLQDLIKTENEYSADLLDKIMAEFTIQDLQLLLSHISWSRDLSQANDLRKAQIETVNHLIQWYNTRPDKIVAAHELGAVIQDVYEMVHDKLKYTELVGQKESRNEHVTFKPDIEDSSDIRDVKRFIIRYDDGNKWKQFKMLYDKVFGQYRSWYENGKKKEFEIYRRGNIVKGISWFSSGRIKSRTKYIPGIGTNTILYYDDENHRIRLKSMAFENPRTILTTGFYNTDERIKQYTLVTGYHYHFKKFKEYSLDGKITRYLMGVQVLDDDDNFITTVLVGRVGEKYIRYSRKRQQELNFYIYSFIVGLIGDAGDDEISIDEEISDIKVGKLFDNEEWYDKEVESDNEQDESDNEQDEDEGDGGRENNESENEREGSEQEESDREQEESENEQEERGSEQENNESDSEQESGREQDESEDEVDQDEVNQDEYERNENEIENSNLLELLDEPLEELDDSGESLRELEQHGDSDREYLRIVKENVPQYINDKIFDMILNFMNTPLGQDIINDKEFIGITFDDDLVNIYGRTLIYDRPINIRFKVNNIPIEMEQEMNMISFNFFPDKRLR